MSYTLSDPSLLHFAAPHIPAHPHRLLFVSLGVGIVTSCASLAFIAHQIGQLPDVDPKAQPGPVVDYASIVPRDHGKLAVLTPDDSAPVVNAAPVPSIAVKALSADVTSTEASDLIAALQTTPVAAEPQAVASVSGPGQVIEMASASDREPAAPYLVAVPDEEFYGESYQPAQTPTQ